jgi:hypothetical protein
MSLWRRSLVYLLSLVLFLSLLWSAYLTSGNIAFRHPDKVKVWLKESNLYGHFVADVIAQGQKSAGDQEPGTVSLSDSAVQQAAQTSFTSDSIQKNVESFLDANYAWLEGKTDKPSFAIDLTQAKQTFAEQVAQYTKTRLATLPVCTAAQLQQIQASGDLDPLSISCRPAYLTPDASAAQVKSQIENSQDFLSNPVVTADNFSQSQGVKTSQPYYKKLSFAPTVYKVGAYVPFVAGLLAVLSAIGVVFLSSRKRTGLRKVGLLVLFAGVILVAGKFLADYAFDQAKKSIVNAQTVGQLQQALTDFLRRAESQLVKVDEYFGVAFLLIGAAIMIYLYVSLKSASETPAPSQLPAEELNESETPTEEPEAPKNKPSPKPPRLIQ